MAEYINIVKVVPAAQYRDEWYTLSKCATCGKEWLRENDSVYKIRYTRRNKILFNYFCCYSHLQQYKREHAAQEKEAI